ncbi:hypothetical protein [Synechococcus sp. Tobar12-5m-g]|uniref:hypothetical protein n=2 Tax=unclassified Synechococcus TaxID=2626047 RepID=UPI0020CC44B0|nr:hypothetical protein [Synechococcus sp. Tobar12-5m-g]
MTLDHCDTPMDPPATPDLNVLATRMEQLEKEIKALNTLLTALRPILERLLETVEPHQGQAPPFAQDPGSMAPKDSPLQAAAPGTSTLLARRNAERLNAEVMRRSARGLDPDNDTELDLLIDRLHELSEEQP